MDHQVRTTYDAPRGERRQTPARAGGRRVPATSPSRSVFSAETNGARDLALLGLLRRRAMSKGGRPTAAKANLGGRALSQGGHGGHRPSPQHIPPDVPPDPVWEVVHLEGSSEKEGPSQVTRREAKPKTVPAVTGNSKIFTHILSAPLTHCESTQLALLMPKAGTW